MGIISFDLGNKTYIEVVYQMITQYKGKCFLFASESGGYWHSDGSMAKYSINNNFWGAIIKQ
jgi:hypothetical protein